MGPEMHLIRRCLIAGAACLTLASAVAPAESRAQLTEMGHRAIATDGPRPLLTLMGDFSDQRFDAGHDAPFYADLLFANGRGAPASLDEFFRENSNGVFDFVPAPIPSTVPAGHRAGGILGPYRQPDNPATALDESTYANRGANPTGVCRRADRAFATRCNVLMRAVQAGFPFRNFDDNNDGCVTNDELTIMIVFAEPSRAAGGMPTGGQAAGVGPLPLPGSSVSLCPFVANVGEAVPASTAAQVLTYTLGAEASYGSSCRNHRFTVMSCALGAEDSRQIVHIDPFVKMKLGWVRPTPIATTTATCVRLRAVDLPSLMGTSRAYVIHDPARGPNEYYLLEYRVPRPGNYDDSPWGQPGLPDEGLAIWSVRIDPLTKRLREVASYDGAGTDAALFLIPPAGTPGEPIGSNGLWSREDGTATLRWLSDGAAATRVSVQSVAGDKSEMTVRIGGGTCPPPA